VSADWDPTVLLFSEGRPAVCGANVYGVCNILTLDDDVACSLVTTGHYHTLFLRSNGRAEACRSNGLGACDSLPWDGGVLARRYPLVRFARCCSVGMTVLLLAVSVIGAILRPWVTT
jgi:hypothetical protein